jgi:hypothetical protein
MQNQRDHRHERQARRDPLEVSVVAARHPMAVPCWTISRPKRLSHLRPAWMRRKKGVLGTRVAPTTPLPQPAHAGETWG